MKRMQGQRRHAWRPGLCQVVATPGAWFWALRPARVPGGFALSWPRRASGAGPPRVLARLGAVLGRLQRPPFPRRMAPQAPPWAHASDVASVRVPVPGKPSARCGVG